MGEKPPPFDMLLLKSSDGKSSTDGESPAKKTGEWLPPLNGLVYLRSLFLLGHGVFDQTDDGHQHAAADTALEDTFEDTHGTNC